MSAELTMNAIKKVIHFLLHSVIYKKKGVSVSVSVSVWCKCVNVMVSYNVIE